MSGILKARCWSSSDMAWSPVAILRICRKMSEEMMFYCSTRQVKIFPSLKFLNFSAEKKFGESMVLYRSLVRRANVGLYFACARFCSAIELCFCCWVLAVCARLLSTTAAASAVTWTRCFSAEKERGVHLLSGVAQSIGSWFSYFCAFQTLSPLVP